MIELKNYFQLEITKINQLEEWLRNNHKNTKRIGILVNSNKQSLNYISKPAILKSLIKYGWINSAEWKIDDYRSLQIITKRSIQPWTNEQKVIANQLIENNELTEAGKKVILNTTKNENWGINNKESIMNTALF